MTRGIYVITNIVNGKQYVGSSGNIEQRWSIHKSNLRCGAGVPKLQPDWKNHGADAFVCNLLEEVEESIHLRKREHVYVMLLQPEYNTANLAPEPRQNVTQQWPIALRRAVDAAAAGEGKTRTEFVLDELLRHPAVRKALEASDD